MLAGSDALYRTVDVVAEDSMETYTLLEGGTFAKDDINSLAEITTWVPDCKWYQKLPCTCAHVIFHSPDRVFLPGWGKLWHLPTLKAWLPTQKFFKQVQHWVEPVGIAYWRNGAFPLKSDLDVMDMVMRSYTERFPNLCRATPDCALSVGFLHLVSWLFTLKQFTAPGLPNVFDQYKGYLDSLAHPAVVQVWKEAPWHMLLVLPNWAAAFIFASEHLEDLLRGSLSVDPAVAAAGSDLSNRVARRLGVRDGTQAWWDALEEGCLEGLYQQHEDPVELMEAALQAAFGERCDLDMPIKRLVLFGRAVRPVLEVSAARADPEVFISIAGPASSSASPWVYRLCGRPGAIAHRRVDHAELHFLAADVVEVHGRMFLELLWLATSDDRCLMLGTEDYAEEVQTGAVHKSYYSFVHTLPAAHLVHWRCSVRIAGAPPRDEEPAYEATTNSFSGFLSATSCLLPEDLAQALRAAGSSGSSSSSSSRPPALEVELLPHGRGLAAHSDGDPGEWRPEALRICPRPAPAPRRRVSACTALLHNAERMYKLAPHLIEDWINYHLLIGVEHFTLFDSDGSYAPYVAPFVHLGVVDYRGQWPRAVHSKLGGMAASVGKAERRPMILEPHAIDTCMWANRQVSDWVVVLHSFEEYLHSTSFQKKAVGRPMNRMPELLPELLDSFQGLVADAVIYELLQEPMGGPRPPGRRKRSVLSTWAGRRGDGHFETKTFDELDHAAANHLRPFSWIARPANVSHTAIHVAQARGDGQVVLTVNPSELRVNHYVDLGANSTRCEKELGGCDVFDDGMLWAEPFLVRMRGWAFRAESWRR